MSSYQKPLVATFYADGAIAVGCAVKPGTDAKHVAVASASTDKLIGIAQNAAVNAGDAVEVALPGGGAKGLCSGVVAAGDLLTADGAGNLVATTSANDRLVAVAMDLSAANDIIPVMVIAGNY